MLIKVERMERVGRGLLGCVVGLALAATARAEHVSVQDDLAHQDIVTLCRGAMYETGAPEKVAPRTSESEVLACVFERMQHRHEMVNKPWLRCLKETEQGMFSAVFPLAETTALQNGMQASDPLAIERWYWMAKGELSDLKTARFAAIRGSNQHAWLLARGLSVVAEASSITQLFDLLDSGRISAIIATDQELELARQRGVSHYFVRYLPLRAYFSSRFLQQHYGFLDQFNSHIHQCQPDNWVQLSDNDEAQLEAHALRYRDAVQRAMTAQLLAQNARHQALTQDEILRLDRLWVGEQAPARTALRQSVLASDLARQLRELKAQSGGIIEEFFVIDARGLLLASSDQTTDYWQGDETKFTESFGRGPGAIFIDKVRFDQSSKTFLSQISATLVDTEGRAIGAVMIGIDVEQALSHMPELE